MKFSDVIEYMASISDLKRVSIAYVSDLKDVKDEALKKSLLMAEHHYLMKENIGNQLDAMLLSPNNNERVLTWLIVKTILLHTDDNKVSKKTLFNHIVEYEESIVNQTNPYYDQYKISDKENIKWFKSLLMTMYEGQQDISDDEKVLLSKMMMKCKVTQDERNIIEAAIGQFPKLENKLHSIKEVNSMTLKLQKLGLLFKIDHEDTTYYVIPDEIAVTLKRLLNLEIKQHGYMALIGNVHMKGKTYLRSILESNGVVVNHNLNLSDLKYLCMTYVKPSVLLGGMTTRGGIDTITLSNWCSELHLPISGKKSELIYRIIEFYDHLEKDVKVQRRESIVYYERYDHLTSKGIEALSEKSYLSTQHPYETLNHHISKNYDAIKR